MSDAADSQQPTAAVLQFPDRGLERWAGVRDAIEWNMRTHGENAEMIATIAARMHDRFIKAGMASSAIDVHEQIIAQLFVQLFEFEIFLFQQSR